MGLQPRQTTAWGQSPLMPTGTVHVNGTTEQKLDRLAIRELAESFAAHRDAQEWDQFLDIFTDDALVFTTWGGATPVKKFIEMSVAGFAAGARIMHRCFGVTVETKGDRGLAKLKASIHQRFDWPASDGDGTIEVDVEAQGRFCFFVEKQAGEWKCAYYKAFYEKDAICLVRPGRLPLIDEAKLASFPYGYRNLGYAQEVLGGHKVLRNLPEARGNEFDLMYDAFQLWFDHAPRAEVDKLLHAERV